MGFHLAKPSDLLAPYVKNYWGMENRLGPGESSKQRIIPSGLSELIFYLGDLPHVVQKKKQVPDNVLLSGQQNGHYDLKLKGHLSLFSVVFQPHGLKPFFHLPAGEFYNQTVPLNLLFRNETNNLEEQLAETDTFWERIELVEHFLLNRLIRSEETYEYRRITHSIEIINRRSGDVSIDQLASSACLSRKQFERTFLNYVGASPKRFLRTVRFQRAIHERALHKNLSLTELSYRCAFYDQSHMTADFQKLSGMSPRSFFADCEPYSDYFQ